MAIINLKDHYPYYGCNLTLDVADDIATSFYNGNGKKATFSVDAGGIMITIL